ncbi:MAG: L,D-transpeptidase family protein [Wenzhouxiangella sp.]
MNERRTSCVTAGFRCGIVLTAFVAGLFAWPAGAGTHALDRPGIEVVGEITHEFARRSDTLMDIARWLNLGYYDIRRANPQVDLWLPGEGTRVLIPSRYVLPDAPREGIVVNLAELRLYHYRNTGDGSTVTTYPVGVGRTGLETPLGRTRVTARVDNPAWYPPESARADYASRGIDLPRVIPPGPDNPLGDHAIALALDGYLIHGTDRPDGVGMRVSRGCIRLYPEDIAELVGQVAIGTPVHIVDQPVKAGFDRGQLWLEAHRLADGEAPPAAEVAAVIHQASRRGREAAMLVDWRKVASTRLRADGVPRPIGLVPGS